jgi:hypothetical protein
MDDLWGRLAGDRPVKLVLHCIEESDAGVGGWIVAHAGGVDVGDLLDKNFL